MKYVLGVIWEALKGVWEELLILVLMNLLTVLLMIPVVTFPPAVAGLWNVANLVAQDKSVAWSDYFEGFRRYFWKAWGLALLNILVIGALVANVRFYSPGVMPFRIGANASLLIRAFWVSALFLWLILQLYPLALLLEQQDQRLRVALRNAFVLLAANPGFSFVLFVSLLIIGAISLAIPALLALITLAVFAVVCNKAVRHLLQPYREQAEREAQERAAEEEGEAENMEEAGE